MEVERMSFFNLPFGGRCNDPEHYPPTHLWVPPGMGFRHVCPKCGRVSEIHGRPIDYSNPRDLEPFIR